MNIEEFREYCLSKKGVTEGFPFDASTLVFKVMGKMFALTDLNDVFWFNLKCDPIRAESLRATYACVTPAYHMNKQHWNSVRPDGSITDKLIIEWIDHSYNLVVNSLTKKQKEELATR